MYGPKGTGSNSLPTIASYATGSRDVDTGMSEIRAIIHPFLLTIQLDLWEGEEARVNRDSGGMHCDQVCSYLEL